MLYILHLEPLEERYSKQWQRWFSQACTDRNISHQFVPGAALSHNVRTGLVLDAEGTNYWKFQQLQWLCLAFERKQIKSGDVFFTMDVWHPGLEAIPYMAELEKVDVKIYGFLHAGSYTEGDFCAPMAKWAQFFERGWTELCDKVFVGSEYHKQDFLAKRSPAFSNKILVTGNPLNTGDILKELNTIPATPCDREKVIVFSHRWDSEKRPDVAISILNRLRQTRDDFRVVFTTGRSSERRPELDGAKFPWVAFDNLTKQEYYRQVAKARVALSTAEAENFGYCITEAMALGCSVVVPDRLSYPEIVPKGCLYSSEGEAAARLSHFLDNPSFMGALAARYNGSVDRILSAMGY